VKPTRRPSARRQVTPAVAELQRTCPTVTARPYPSVEHGIEPLMQSGPMSPRQLPRWMRVPSRSISLAAHSRLQERGLAGGCGHVWLRAMQLAPSGPTVQLMLPLGL
jgi:hypothetical protein